MTRDDNKVGCRTPAQGRDGVTHIPAWKFDVVRGAILEVLGDNAMPFAQLRDAVGSKLAPPVLERLGSLGWHATTVKLEMEVRGDVARAKQNGRQVLTRVS